MAGNISGLYVGVTAAGAVLVWSGWRGATLTATLGALLRGNLNAPDTESVAPVAAPAAAAAAPAVPSATLQSGALSVSALESLWTSNGGDAGTAFIAANVANAESSGIATATSPNPDGGENVGIWQLDTKGVGAGYTVAELENPDTNAVLTIMATANGTNWSQWADSVVVNGQYVGPVSPVPPNRVENPG